MKRILVERYGGPEALELQDSEAPRPGPGEILIGLHAAGINPVDVYRRQGSQGYTPDLPFCPGFEGAGEILAVGPPSAARETQATDPVRNPAGGPGASGGAGTAAGAAADLAATGAGTATAAGTADSLFDFKPGDRVYAGWTISGTYGQWCLAKSSQVFPVPLGMSMNKAAGLFVNYFTAYRALVLRGGLVPREKVLVHGASGGVGLACLQWCGYLGNPVWGSAGSEAGLELVRRWGAREAADHRRPGELAALAGGIGGFDVIVEMRADRNLEADLSMLAPGGRVMVVGSRGETTVTPRKTMGIEADVRGVVLFRNSDGENLLIHRELEKAAATGDINPVITREYPLTEAGRAHEELMNERASGKRILTCRGSSALGAIDDQTGKVPDPPVGR